MGSSWVGDTQPPAGTRLLTYDLEFKCDPGFFLRGTPYVRCVPADMGEFPECSDVCEPSNPDCPVQNDGITASLDAVTDSDRCGIVSNAPTALAGGRTALPGDVPWQAAIYDKSTSPFMQVCGGSLVSKDVVISAAHCFKLPDQFYAVAVGKIYRPYNNPSDIGVQKSEVLEVRIPPRYRGSVTSFQDDIAAVILETPIQFTSMILPVCLHFGADFDEVQLAPGTLGRVAGWGIDSINGRPSQVLNLAEMPMVDIGTCFMLQDESFIQYITSDKFCAGYTNGTSLCKGDSGGGLAVPHRSGYTTKYYLRGIVSTGPPPDTVNECNVEAVTTFTRVAKHEYFVKSAIAKKPLQQSELRTPPIIPANFINSNKNILGNDGANEGVPLKVDPVVQIGSFNNQRPMIGNSRDPQADAPGTVVVIPDTLTVNGAQNAQVLLKEYPAQTSGLTNERPVIGNSGKSRDPQADAPGTIVVIPDTLTVNGAQNTQVPLTEYPAQTSDFTKQKPVIGNFGYSRDPQADAPGTVVVIPDTLTVNGAQNTQVPLTEYPAQTSDFTKQKPVIGNFGNSRDPQADAPGTVVVIPETLTTDDNENLQFPLTGEQTSMLTNQQSEFDNSRGSQADAPGTVVVIPSTLPIDVNNNTEDPLREDSVQPVGIFENQRPVVGFNRDSNIPTPASVAIIPKTLTNNERPIKDSFAPKPIDGIDENEKVSIDFNTDKKVSLDTTRRVPTVTIISEGAHTTSSPQLQHSAHDYFNYQHWPYHPSMPYQYKPNQNWNYPSQNGNYQSQNGQYPSQSGHYQSQNGHYPSQSVYYPNQNEHPSSHNVGSNGYFGQGLHHSDPVWNSPNHIGYHHGHWWRK